MINALYREETPSSFLNRLNGIFAFALWDRERGAALIARDPIGVCPLYWGHDAEGRQRSIPPASTERVGQHHRHIHCRNDHDPENEQEEQPQMHRLDHGQPSSRPIEAAYARAARR